MRPLARWECVAGAVTATALTLLLGFAWEAGQSALPPPPAAHTHARPPPRGHPGLYPPPEPLLDLPSASLVANSAACGSSRLLFVLLVVSHPSHAGLRDAQRAHASRRALDALGARRVFFLADSSGSGQAEYPAVPLAAVLRESALHGDLVVADFRDHYRNLTYKHALAISWAGRFCQGARYLLKMDDDIMVDVWGVAKLLRAGLEVDRWGVAHPAVAASSSSSASGVPSGGRRRLLESRDAWTAGLVQRGLKPQRGAGKWRVTREEYPGPVYPDFLAGWAYVATRAAAGAILRAAADAAPFWIDDVHLTGTLASAAGVPRYALNRHYTLLKGAAACCLAGPLHRREEEEGVGVAPLCGHLVAPSGKDAGVLGRWLRAARACHEGGACPRPPPDACPPAFPHHGVGSVVPLS